MVFCVILLVKSVTLPTTLLENSEIPEAIEAANSPPGKLGNAPPPERPGLEGRTVLGPAVLVGE